MVAAFRELSPSAIELLDKSVFKTMSREWMIAPYSRTEADYLVFCEFEGSEPELSTKAEEMAASRAGRYDPLVLSSSSEIAKAWDVRNETLTLALEIRSESRSLLPGVEDLVVPPDRLADLVALLRGQFESRGLTYISYGHAADANIHARPLLDSRSSAERRMLEEMMQESFEAVWKMGGSMTGEHGDGMLRAKYVARQYPRTHQIMKEIRDIYDPKGVLNPGVKIV
jgi:glycolate oxidase